MVDKSYTKKPADKRKLYPINVDAKKFCEKERKKSVTKNFWDKKIVTIKNCDKQKNNSVTNFIVFFFIFNQL